jgi:chromate transporter
MNPIVMHAGDWVALLVHYLSLSLLCVGGAITTAPDMHRFLVQEKGWLTDPQFSASIAIAQSAPGPNVLFTASVLVYLTAQWSHRNRDLRAVRAFKQGMAPLVVALLVATGWILATANGYALANWPGWAITIVTALIVWRTRLHLLWLLGAGAVLGWMGWV